MLKSKGLVNRMNLLSLSKTNLRGKRIERKIVVIESDDWGTVRMSSKESFLELLKKGDPIEYGA